MTKRYYDVDDAGKVVHFARPQRKNQPSIDIPDLSKSYEMVDGELVEVTPITPLDVKDQLEAWADNKAATEPGWFSVWSKWMDRFSRGLHWWAEGNKQSGKALMLELVDELEASTNPAPNPESVATIRAAINSVTGG